MLYNLDWLKVGEKFPPASEQERLITYYNNEAYFNNEHWNAQSGSIYYEYAKRITRVVGNFSQLISFPVLMNYQRTLALKTADLTVGEHPLIQSHEESKSATLTEIRENIDFDSKMFATVVDLCRFGDALWRLYKDEDGKGQFVVWDVKDWFPIVSQDGTLRVTHHVIAWLVEYQKDQWELHVQVHTKGQYEYRVYEVSSPSIINVNGVAERTILAEKRTRQVIPTGYDTNAIMHIRNLSISNTIFGFDDFTPIDSLVAELMTRIAQISNILDKHSDPSMTGPVSMLKYNKETQEYYFEAGDFYGINPEEQLPEYLVWDGQLDSAFKQVELLLNQLYILSEMGSALLGSGDGSTGQAISGTALRFKMANPLAKARRITNILSLPVKTLFSSISTIGYDQLNKEDISVVWQDGLPDDPTEVMELVGMATGETRIMPLKIAIQENLKRTPKEADEWIKMNEEAAQKQMDMQVDQEMRTAMPKKGNKSVTGLNKFNRDGQK